MTKTKKVILLVLVLQLLVVALWFFLPGSGDSTVPGQTPTATKVSERLKNGDRTDVDPELPENGSIGETAEGGETQMDSADLPLERIGELLPEWIRGHGKRFQDRREINGHTALRSRARYEWENGERLEYDSVDQCCSIQLLVENRYLIEIQINNMPKEAFQEVLDRDVSFEEIFNRMGN